MRLTTLLQRAFPLASPISLEQDIEVYGLTLNTQQLQQGELFIALKGRQCDGRQFIQEAISKGASAVLFDADAEIKPLSYISGVPIVGFPGLAGALGGLIQAFYGECGAGLEVIGVTGTNGKTTTTYLLAQALSRLGIPCGIVGTIGYGLIPRLHAGSLTTPDPITLQKYFGVLKAEGARSVAMEVSSHGLEQGRVKSICFQSALFTNLTQDHLDFHTSMEQYSQAKQKLFACATLQRAVLNQDSPFTKKMMQALKPGVSTLLYSLNDTSKLNTAFIRVKRCDWEPRGMVVQLSTSWGTGVLRSTLLGTFNLSNLLCVLGELCLREIRLQDALDALQQVTPPPGRMQRLGGGQAPEVIVDYAHTPDALEHALKAARLHCRRRLWCVFGCGGERDRDKRSKMGSLAAQWADKVVLTSDNPRSESAARIIEDILKGVAVKEAHKVVVEEDRTRAIEHAIRLALPVDTILIAGKGHESHQIIQDKKYPFNDVHCVNAILGDK